jgi:hypothetical protein
MLPHFSSHISTPNYTSPLQVIDSFRPELRYELMQNMQGSAQPPNVPGSLQQPTSSNPQPLPPNHTLSPPPISPSSQHPSTTTQLAVDTNPSQIAPFTANVQQEGRSHELPASTAKT